MLISRTLYKIETFETCRVKSATARSTACRRPPIATCLSLKWLTFKRLCLNWLRIRKIYYYINDMKNKWVWDVAYSVQAEMARISVRRFENCIAVVVRLMKDQTCSAATLMTPTHVASYTCTDWLMIHLMDWWWHNTVHVHCWCRRRCSCFSASATYCTLLYVITFINVQVQAVRADGHSKQYDGHSQHGMGPLGLLTVLRQSASILFVVQRRGRSRQSFSQSSMTLQQFIHSFIHSQDLRQQLELALRNKPIGL